MENKEAAKATAAEEAAKTETTEEVHHKARPSWVSALAFFLAGCWIGGAIVYGPAYSGRLGPDTIFTGLIFGWARVIFGNFPAFLLMVVIFVVVVMVFTVLKRINAWIWQGVKTAWDKLKHKWNDRPEEKPQKQKTSADHGSLSDLGLGHEEEEPEAPATKAATPAPVTDGASEAAAATEPLTVASPDVNEQRMAIAVNCMPLAGATDKQSFTFGVHQALNGLPDTPMGTFASNEEDRKRGFQVAQTIFRAEQGV